jgi:hypothetical protein
LPFPLAPFPLPFAFPFPFPFPFPLPVPATTVVTTPATTLAPPLAAVPALLTVLLPLLLVLLLLLLWLLLATDELVADPEESQTVVVLEAFLVTPPALDVSRARPWVTRWKFRWTSPIEDEMRVTPGLPACTFVCREG